MPVRQNCISLQDGGNAEVWSGREEGQELQAEPWLFKSQSWLILMKWLIYEAKFISTWVQRYNLYHINLKLGEAQASSVGIGIQSHETPYVLNQGI